MIIGRRAAKYLTMLISPPKLKKTIKALIKNLDVTKTITLYKELNKNTNQAKKILVIEPNRAHGEVIVGIVKYLIDLGFEVDVLLRSELIAENPFKRFKHKNIRIFEVSLFILYFMTKQLVARYKKTIISSSAFYCWIKTKDEQITYLSFLRDFAQGVDTKNILLIEHDLNDIERFAEQELLNNHQIITLADLGKAVFVNPHYFGPVVNLPKNTVTNFIVVGGIEIARKNHQALIAAVQNLVSQEILDFKITIIGEGTIEALPEEIASFIEIKGRLDFEKMYDELDKADFFMPLLDQDNIAHNRYLTTATSGSFQLIYGFLKPAIINQKFAEIHKFNTQNAIVYNNNDLTTAMLAAINISRDKYSLMQNSLKALTNDIYKKSLANLASAIAGKKIPIVFAFDDNYALPAYIAIKSLLDSKDQATEYDIFVLYSDINNKNIKLFNKLAKINWIEVAEGQFANFPIGWSGIATYYRLIIQDLIPQYDTIIWSDVDVLFKKDLSNVYSQNIDSFYWAGVKAEYNNDQVCIHKHFENNKNEFIYMPGFMLINAKKMREEGMTAKFFDVIREYNTELKFFDLDVLNLACDKIGEISFDYCVLENIYENNDISTAPEYPWLNKVYGHQALQNAKSDPAIIHYAGKDIKIWLRELDVIPQYYLGYIKNSPFFSIYRQKFRKLMSIIDLSKKARKKWRKLSKTL